MRSVQLLELGAASSGGRCSLFLETPSGLLPSRGWTLVLRITALGLAVGAQLCRCKHISEPSHRL